MSKHILLFVTISLLVSPSFVLAQSSQEDLETQRRLNEVESKRATRTATVSDTKKPTEISFIEGVVSSITNPTIVITTTSGTKFVYTGDTTKFLNFDSKGKKLIGFGDLKIGETILVIGLVKETGSGTAKLVVRDQNVKTKHFSLLGRISEVGETLVLRDFRRDELPTNKITTIASTVIKSGNSTISKENLKQDDKVVTTGTIDDKGSLIASEIRKF